MALCDLNNTLSPLRIAFQVVSDLVSHRTADYGTHQPHTAVQVTA